MTCRPIFAGFGSETGDKRRARRMVPAACRLCLLLHGSQCLRPDHELSAGLVVAVGGDCVIFG